MSQTRDCKYGCGELLEWNNSRRAFDEADSGMEHTYERCKQIKAEKKAAQDKTSTPSKEEKKIDVQEILKDLKGTRGLIDSVIKRLESL